MKARHLTLVIFSLCFSLCTFAQQKCTYQKSHFTVSKSRTVNVSGIKTDWNVQLLNLDKPVEGNKAYAEYINKIKAEAEKKYPRKDLSLFPYNEKVKSTPDTPVVVKAFEGNIFGNNIPNDNTLAISNNGMLISNINCNIYIYNTQHNDTLLKTVSLSAFSDTLQLYPEQYDPKLLYDPSVDKFVMAYLAGYVDSTSDIVVAFSQTNNPLGLWNLYYLSGNPLADSSWSDFPSIALTQNELFLTVNLLKDTGTWQTAFKQTVIWQIDKNKGYNGDTLKTKLWSQIKYDGTSIRNLDPVQGGSALVGPDIYLLSDRNFAIQNDTFFLLHISDVLTDTNAVLTVTPVLSDKNYGMPPSAKQPQNQTFATNDARVLGSFIENDKIQFVGNTMDTLSGLATIYHGIINNLSTTPSLHLKLMSDTLEFGYPNISYTGNGPSDNSAIIGADYSAFNVYAGLCAFNYNGITGLYSSRGILKTGTSYINFFTNTDPERWGDYSGNQRVYNDPGKVWVSGTWGKKASIYSRVNATWIAELHIPAPDAGVSNFNFNEQASMNAYPNPVSDLEFVEVTIPYNATIDVSLFDNNGKLVRTLLHGPAEIGKNILSFSTKPLSKGIYLLTVKDSRNIFLTKKIVKE